MFEEWVAMEEFYYQNFWIGLILFTIVAFVFVISIFNRENRWLKGLNTASLLVAIGIAVFLYIKYQHHQPLINQSVRLTPAQRSYQRLPFSQSPYSFYEKKVYENGYMKDSFMETSLYKENSHIQEVEYAGEDDRGYYYFKIAGQDVYTGEKYVDFDEAISQPVRRGSSFRLIDPHFMEIGFYEESSVYFDKYIVPLAAVGEKVEDEVRRSANYQSRETIAAWIYP